MSELEIAILFHETYERLAPQFGYETRPDTKQFDPGSKNGRLMVAVCSEVMRAVVAATRSQALQEAAQAVAAIRINTKKFSHVENVGSFATGIETAVLTLRALAAQPAASPACSNCGVAGQVSGPGTATLCMACGAVEL